MIKINVSNEIALNIIDIKDLKLIWDKLRNIRIKVSPKILFPIL